MSEASKVVELFAELLADKIEAKSQFCRDDAEREIYETISVAIFDALRQFKRETNPAYNAANPIR